MDKEIKGLEISAKDIEMVRFTFISLEKRYNFMNRGDSYGRRNH